MTSRVANLLASARVAELRAQAKELASVARPPGRVEVARSSSANRRLLLLVARERRRSAVLLAELGK